MEARHTAVRKAWLVLICLTEGLEDGDASATRAADGVVPDDALVRRAV